MKTAIVYYSMSGNTAAAARKVAEGLHADLTEIKPEKAFPDKGIRKFLWGGKSAVMAETPKLMPYTFDAGQYDMIVIGFPVWANNVAPPIRTFAAENKEAVSNKKIAAFACQGGSGAEKAFRKLLDCMGRDSFAATMVLNDPTPQAENDQVITSFLTKLSQEN
jgi:flavodoxin